MTTDSLHFPSLLSTPYPGVTTPRNLPSPWPGLDTLDRWRHRSSEAFRKHGLARKIRRAAGRGEALCFGTVASPYDPEVDEALWENASLWHCSHSVGLDIVTRSPRILDGLESLTLLDRWHAVHIDMLIPCVDPRRARRLEPRAADPDDRLQALKDLGDRGLTTRLIIPIPPGQQRPDGRWSVNMPWGNEQGLSRLVRAAAEAGVYDIAAIVIDGSGGSSRTRAESMDLPWQIQLRRLRLQAGLPNGSPGRG